MNKQVPPIALDIVIKSLAPSTQKQYSSALKQWWEFCTKTDSDFYTPTRQTILTFLTERFESGASYGTLNSLRSAISLISCNKIGEDETITRFLKGAFKTRPAKPKYNYTWDVSVVIKFLSTLYPLNKLSLKDLTLKTSTLLALSTAHRMQTLSLIKISNFIETPTRLEIKIPDNIKTSGPDKYQPLLIISKFEKYPEICVYSCIKEYLRITNSLRGSVDNLLIATRKPHEAVCSETIST